MINIKTEAVVYFESFLLKDIIAKNYVKEEVMLLTVVLTSKTFLASPNALAPILALVLESSKEIALLSKAVSSGLTETNPELYSGIRYSRSLLGLTLAKTGLPCVMYPNNFPGIFCVL